MLFSRVVSFVAFSMTLGSFALANPVVVEKRDVTGVQQVVTNLQSSTNAILPQIQSLSSSKNVTDSTAVPLVDQLIAAFNTATVALRNVSTSTTSSTSAKRQSASLEEIAQTTANVIQSMTTALSALVNSSNGNIPLLSNHITTLYTSTTSFLTQLDTTSGLAGLLGGLLGSVLPLITGLLGGLGGGAGLGSLLSLLLGLLGL